MSADFCIRKKIAHVCPEGLPAIRLVGLKQSDDERFMHAVERRFSSPEPYKSILGYDSTTLTEKQQKSLIRALSHAKHRFKYRRYPDKPSWLDIIPQNLPPGVLKEHVPAHWYQILVAVLHDLGYFE